MAEFLPSLQTMHRQSPAPFPEDGSPEVDEPVVPSVEWGSLTYEPYYGLIEKPFGLSADPQFFYKSQSHGPAFEKLTAAIRRREGLIVLTGDIGTGKTTLCRSVLEHLDRKTFSSFVPDPFMSREDLLKMLLIDFGVMSIDDLKAGRLREASRLDLSYLLYEFLDSLVLLDAFAVLVIDEAQNLSLPLLEEVRILSELERREKLLQLVLVGQLELQARLRLPQMRQVDQRVSMRCELTPLGREEVSAYVKHRLSVASAGYYTVGFSRTALAVVHQASGGVPRLINLICDRALQRGFLRQVERIDPEMVSQAIIELGLRPAPVNAAEPVAPVTDAVKTAAVEEASTFPAERTQQANRAPRVESTADALSEWPTESGHTVLRRLEPQQSRPRRTTASWPALAGTLIIAAILGVTLGTLWYVKSLASRDVVQMPVLLAPPTFSSGPTFATPLTPNGTLSATITDSTPASTDGDVNTNTNDAGYFVQVASFQSAERAARLVDELSRSGYVARQVEVDMGERGRFQEVVIDGYKTREAAESDLEHIHAVPGYDDARIVRRSPG